jgi:hypothetical protein
VGRLSTTDSFAGFVVGRDTVLAYVCNGTDAGVSRYGWFRGTLGPDGSFQGQDSSGNRLSARLIGDSVSGSVTFDDGTAATFQLDRAVRDAGLFRFERTVSNDTVVGGWIVVNDGDVRGQIEHRSASGGATFIGTGSFDPVTHTVQIAAGDVNGEFIVPRVTPDSLP